MDRTVVQPFGILDGIIPRKRISTSVRQALYPHAGSLLPGTDSTRIRSFYRYYVSTLKEQGFDFLKVDNQAFTLPLYMGGHESIRQATDCNRSLEAEIHRQNMGLMNCMAQNVINTDHTSYSNSTRVSIDYKKYDEDMAKSHLFQSYTNTLLLGQTVWPDHDMFHSCDTVCGTLMARSKAISGGPVYLSDAPGDFIKENIFPLIDKQGKLFRPEAPAVPMPESILTNPLWSGKAYRVAAPSGNGAMTFICYNLNVSPRHQQVQATIKKKIILFGTVLRKCLPPPKNACCFIIGNHKRQKNYQTAVHSNLSDLQTNCFISAPYGKDGQSLAYRKSICPRPPSKLSL